MIKEFIDAWDKNKNDLEKYFRENKMEQYDDYLKIVKLIFGLVINPYIEKDLCDLCLENYNVNKIHVIDDGYYQGTQIFLIPQGDYQPSAGDYVYTNTYYGTCSGCDTLASIILYDYDKFPSDEQIKGFMTLSLHLIQKMNKMVEE